jgi:hypothetical protein
MSEASTAAPVGSLVMRVTLPIRNLGILAFRVRDIWVANRTTKGKVPAFERRWKAMSDSDKLEFLYAVQSLCDTLRPLYDVKVDVGLDVSDKA